MLWAAPVSQLARESPATGGAHSAGFLEEAVGITIFKLTLRWLILLIKICSLLLLCVKNTYALL